MSGKRPLPARRVLVCGSRHFQDWRMIWRVLDELAGDFPIAAIIEGDAPGADRIAGEWAQRNGIRDIKYPADWETHGKAAGPIRNQLMIDHGKPDLVLAFPLIDPETGRIGTGTADLMRRARRAQIEVIQVGP
jgi:hypothetical protein